jgi:hypothetical protein
LARKQLSSSSSPRVFLFFAAGSSMAIVDAAIGAVEAAPSMLDALNALPADMQCGSTGPASRQSAVSFVATAPALVSWHAATQRTILLVPGVMQHQQSDAAAGSTSSSGTATSSSSSSSSSAAVTTTTVSVAAFALAPRGSTTSSAPPRLTALWCAPLPSSVGDAPVTAQMALIADAASNSTVVVVPTAAGIFGLGV